MARDLPSDAIADLLARETGEIYFELIEIDEVSLPDPIRIVANNSEVVTSRGNDYAPCAIEISTPADDGEGPGEMRLTIDNVDQRVADALALAVGRPTVKVEVVRESDPDTVIEGPLEFELDETETELTTVTGNAVISDGMLDLVPETLRSPTVLPDIFR